MLTRLGVKARSYKAKDLASKDLTLKAKDLTVKTKAKDLACNAKDIFMVLERWLH